MKAFNRASGKELAANLTVADTLFSRAKGLLGKKSLPQGEGLLITPCKGVHTFLMKFPIDVVFLDEENRIIESLTDFKPHRMTKVLLACSSVLELPAGTVRASDSIIGNQIAFE
jgi:uncharacterized membrane protein (UPF0127 family)